MPTTDYFRKSVLTSAAFDVCHCRLSVCHFGPMSFSDSCRFRFMSLQTDIASFVSFFLSDITLICRIRLMSLQKFRHLPLPTFARCSGEDFTYLKIAKCLGKRMKMVMWVFCRELLHAKNIVLKIQRENYPNLVFWLKFEPCFHGQKNALQWGLQWNSINWHLGLP